MLYSTVGGTTLLRRVAIDPSGYTVLRQIDGTIIKVRDNFLSKTKIEPEVIETPEGVVLKWGTEMQLFRYNVVSNKDVPHEILEVFNEGWLNYLNAESKEELCSL